LSLSKSELLFLKGKLKLKKGSSYDRKMRHGIRKKLGSEFAVVCVYCERAFSEGKMWEIKTGDNIVYACVECAHSGIKTRKVDVTQEKIRICYSMKK